MLKYMFMVLATIVKLGFFIAVLLQIFDETFTPMPLVFMVVVIPGQ